MVYLCFDISMAVRVALGTRIVFSVAGRRGSPSYTVLRAVHTGAYTGKGSAMLVVYVLDNLNWILQYTFYPLSIPSVPCQWCCSGLMTSTEARHSFGNHADGAKTKPCIKMRTSHHAVAAGVARRLQFWRAQVRGRRVVEQAVGFSPRPQGNCLRSQGFGGWHGPHSTRRPDNLRVQGHGLRAQGESVASFAHVYWFACVVWARVHVFPVESSIAFCTPLKTVLLLHALVNIVLSCEW